MRSLVDAYIDFAFIPVKKSTRSFEVTGLLASIPSLPLIAVPTLELSLTESDEREHNFVAVEGFADKFRSAGE